MLGVIREYRRRKVLAGLGNRSRQKRVLRNMEDIGTLGFSFLLQGAGDAAALEEIAGTLKQQGIPFTGVVVEIKKSFSNESGREEFSNMCKGSNILYIARDELNWIGLPKDTQRLKQLEEFLQQHLDLFIILGRAASMDGASFIEEYMAAQLNADCITSMVNSPKMPCSFVLEPLQGPIAYSEYLNGLFKYLKQINSKEDGR